MPARGPNKPKFPPPTEEQVKKTHLWLKKGAIPEVAMAAAGVPRAQFTEWLRHGAAGTPGYSEFLESIESALNEYQCKLLTVISDAADKGNVSAAQWLYMQRFGFKEKKAQEAEAKAAEAEAVFSAQKQREVDEAEADAAEQRLMGLQ